jgi:hypothetical protein
MFASIRRSIRLIGESYRVLRQDPELIWLTAASFAAVLVLAFVLGGFGLGLGAIDLSAQSVSPFGVIVLAAGYLGSYLVIIYFQVALVAAVMHRMAGGDPSIRYALDEANQRLGAIVQWAVIAATVGLVLRALEGMARNSDNGAARIVGSLAVSLVGLAWGLTVFFVVPVIVMERKTGIEAIKRSGATLKERWGEAVIGNQGVELIVFVLMLVFAGVPIVLGLALMETLAALGAALVVAGIVAGLLLAAGGAALDSTYRAVLYRYATAGETGAFSRNVLDAAFRPAHDIRRSGGYGSI